MSARLLDFIRELRPHDASLGVAVAELLQRADENGVLERGPWLAAVEHSYPERPAGQGAPPLERSSQEELARYIEEHVLGRLTRDGVVVAEPPGETWERVRFTPEVWTSVREDRGAILEEVRDRVETLELAAASWPIDVRDDGSKLAARSLTKVYRKRKVVNDVDITVHQGEIVGLLGPNGAGKTTTFYMITGLISPTSGRVLLDENELTNVPMYQRARRGIGYLAQEPSVFRKLTVEENIRAILETQPMPRAERKQRLEVLLDELSIKHLRGAKAYSLSGGERRRLEITRALVSDPKFMLLDEPFAGVDPIAVHDIQQIVASLRHRGIGVIISDHNVEQTLDIVDRAYIMYDGRVRVSGTVGELVWNDEVAEIYFGPTLTARMRERYRRPEVA